MSCGSTSFPPAMSVLASALSARACVGAMVALMLTLVAASLAGAEMITFTETRPGTAPTNFAFARTGSGGPGQWTVVDDSTAEGGRALEQTSNEKTDYRFPLAIYQPLNAKNVDVSIRFKPIAGAVDQSGGIAVRLRDADNYYIARANALEDNVRLYHVVKGRRSQLKSANLKVAPNVWHTLALKAEGDRFTVSFNGKALYTVTDKTLAQAGKVALWTKSDSVTRFDRFEIKELP
jgi:hypothetical protein